MSAIEARLLSCSRSEIGEVREVSLTFAPATFNVLVGEKEGGKQLLLRLLGLLERPDSGEVLINNRPTRSLEEPAREALRNLNFGYLFNTPFLLPSLSVLENLAMPLFRISHVNPVQAQERIDEVLEFVGLAGATQEDVCTLSSEQQLRVALARGLSNRPQILIIEDLDQTLSGVELMSFITLLRRVSAELQTTVIATASLQFNAGRDRIIEIRNGAASRDSRMVGELEA